MIKVSLTEFKKNEAAYISIIDKESVLVTRYGKPYRLYCLAIEKNNKRIGAAKEEMEEFDISLEELNSIPVNEFYGEN